MKQSKEESLKNLYKALISLENEEECKLFLEDICTIKELQDIAQRLDTAILLDKGENYNTIYNEIGTSAATISRVSRCLNYGNGGYKRIIEKIKKAEETK